MGSKLAHQYSDTNRKHHPQLQYTNSPPSPGGAGGAVNGSAGRGSRYRDDMGDGASSGGTLKKEAPAVPVSPPPLDNPTDSPVTTTTATATIHPPPPSRIPTHSHTSHRDRAPSPRVTSPTPIGGTTTAASLPPKSPLATPIAGRALSFHPGDSGASTADPGTKPASSLLSRCAPCSPSSSVAGSVVSTTSKQRLGDLLNKIG